GEDPWRIHQNSHFGQRNLGKCPWADANRLRSRKTRKHISVASPFAEINFVQKFIELVAWVQRQINTKETLVKLRSESIAGLLAALDNWDTERDGCIDELERKLRKLKTSVTGWADSIQELKKRPEILRSETTNDVAAALHSCHHQLPFLEDIRKKSHAMVEQMARSMRLLCDREVEKELQTALASQPLDWPPVSQRINLK
ncbi:MAG TPA: hypothetical protein PK992_15065, partial [Planctomycetaceae bacterium]|nr:hypothetical protein [Planctomycetaceae bacterium]